MDKVEKVEMVEMVEIEYCASLRLDIEHTMLVDRNDIIAANGEFDTEKIKNMLIEQLENDEVFDEYMESHSPDVEVLKVDFDMEGK